MTKAITFLRILPSHVFRLVLFFPSFASSASIPAAAKFEMNNNFYPGPRWRMHWLDGGLDNLQLDIVGFLAILGEDAVRKTSRLTSLSRLFWLPRLLPAPHSLLYTERPDALDTLRAKVISVNLGSNDNDSVNNVTAALLYACRFL